MTLNQFLKDKIDVTIIIITDLISLIYVRLIVMSHMRTNRFTLWLTIYNTLTPMEFHIAKDILIEEMQYTKKI
jgi:hypothetical protein